MKLKKAHNAGGKKLAIYGTVVLVALVVVAVLNLNKAPIASASTNDKNPINTPTSIEAGFDMKHVITNEINKIYSDSDVSIYINKRLGVPFISYVYQNELSGRERSDNFFLHVYLKDGANNGKFVNMDFSYQEPYKLTIADSSYYIFKRFLDSDQFELTDIDYINTGRFEAGKGRTLNVQKLKIDTLNLLEIDNSFKTILLEISEKGYKKISAKREEALGKKVLVTQDEDLVKAIIKDENKTSKSEIRLKGDWTDHLDHDTKWSFRVIMDGEESLDGMRKFSLQHPKVRNYAWEWLFNKVMKSNDLVGLRYDFVNLELQIVKEGATQNTLKLGVMAREEAFDKILIENNDRREGLIIGFDESLIWEDREKQYELNLPVEAHSKKLLSIGNAPIRVFNEGKVLADENLLKQFNIAKDLLEGVRTGKLLVSDVFDLDKLTTFVALTNLFGGQHGLISHNLRIYYNPISNKLEPISFDSNSGTRLTEIVTYPFTEQDSIYHQKMIEKLELMSSSEFVNNMLEEHFNELESVMLNLNSEFNTKLDLSILEHNSNFIKKSIQPGRTIVAGLTNHDENSLSVEIHNVSDHALQIDNLRHEDGQLLSNTTNISPLKPNEKRTVTFPLKEAFVNAFVSKKNKKGEFRYPKDVDKLVIQHHIVGMSFGRQEHIIPFSKSTDLDDTISQYKDSFIAKTTDHEFAQINQASKEVIIGAGLHVLQTDLIIPKHYKLVFKPGSSLDIQNGASIISYGAFFSEGTAKNPNKIFSSDGSGKGIFVSGASEKSLVNHTTFSNLSNPSSTIWSVSGAVNFHESEVEIKNSTFEKNRCEDGLNIIRTTFALTNTTFSDTQSDAFDGDFVKGSINKCIFVNAGNDGIDVSGSEVFLNNVRIENSSDKAISAGENSRITGKGVDIIGGEIGVVSKDLSKVTLSNVNINSTRLAFSSFQKKSEFGKANIEVSSISLANIERNHLIENGCTLVIDDRMVETVSNSVIDQMYGKEYGKSTR